VESLIKYVADRPGHDLRYAIDATKAAAELAFEPRETFETGLARTVRWYLDNDWWWRPLRKAGHGAVRLGLGEAP
jgi:dTDP-glucose 4,6-dehydratase